MFDPFRLADLVSAYDAAHAGKEVRRPGCGTAYLPPAATQLKRSAEEDMAVIGTEKERLREYFEATTKETIANLKIEYVRVCHRFPSRLIRVMNVSCCYAMPPPAINVFIHYHRYAKEGC